MAYQHCMIAIILLKYWGALTLCMKSKFNCFLFPMVLNCQQQILRMQVKTTLKRGPNDSSTQWLGYTSVHTYIKFITKVSAATGFPFDWTFRKRQYEGAGVNCMIRQRYANDGSQLPHRTEGYERSRTFRASRSRKKKAR